MTHKVTIGRSRRLIVATVLVAMSAVLSGCGSMSGLSNFEPGDLFDFLDTKKKLPGDRKAVFPEGVPGVEQGVPRDLYRGARASANTAAPEPPPPPVAEPPKQQRRVASRPQRQPPVQQEPSDGDAAAAEEGVAAAPPAPPPPRRRAVQRQQPQAQEQPVQQQSGAPAPFPAPLPSGSFSR